MKASVVRKDKLILVRSLSLVRSIQGLYFFHEVFHFKEAVRNLLLKFMFHVTGHCFRYSVLILIMYTSSNN